MLTKHMDEIPLDLDLTYIAKYSPKYGIKVGVYLHEIRRDVLF